MACQMQILARHLIYYMEVLCNRPKMADLIL